MKANNRGNWSLIGLLVVAAIIVGVLAVYFNGGFFSASKDSNLVDKSSTKKTLVGKAIDTAKGVDCREHLNQIRGAIAAYKTTEVSDQNPPSFKDLRMGVSTDYFKCPVSGQPYQYDPATGKVSCLYPAHSAF